MTFSEGAGKTSDAWWRQGVLYQIYPRSFQDTNGDGIGDLAGITRRLSYIAELGATAIWISPFFASPMKDFGYDVVDHRAVDPMFGHLEDFDALVEEAHRLGLKVLIDLVLSHVSDQHPWFIEARKARGSAHEDAFVWADPGPDGGPPNNWLSVFGGPAWTLEPARGQYYLHNFLTSQPDLNFHNPAVRTEALSIVEFWLKRGVDGFRLDTVNFYFHDQQLRDNPPAKNIDSDSVNADNPYGHFDHVYDKNRPEVVGFLEELNQTLAGYGDRMALGEVGAGADRAVELMAEYQAPGRLQLSYAFDLLSDTFSADHFRRFINDDATRGGNLWRCVSFSNHDVRRSATRFAPDDASRDAVVHLSNTLLLSLRGTPCVYQGEELGLTEVDIPYELLQDPYGIHFWPKFKGRDGCRTPMPWDDSRHGSFCDEQAKPWLPVPPEHRASSVGAQNGKEDTALERMRRTLAVRKAEPAFRSDRLELVSSADSLLVYERGSGSERLLFIFNLSSSSQHFEAAATWDVERYVLSGGAVSRYDAAAALELGPWAFAVLRPQS